MNRQIPVDLPEGYIDFYVNLESWQNEQELILKKSCSYEKHNIFMLLPLMSKNKTLLRLKGIDIEPNQYKELYKKFLSLLIQLRSQTSTVVNTLTAEIDNFNFKTILEKFIENDKLYFSKIALDIYIPEELFFFTIDHSIRPFVRIYAEPYKKEILDDRFNPWTFPTICPICGAKSHFSRIRLEDGKHFMFCNRCFSEWETDYLRCVHCGNNEFGTIKYITVEHDEAYQLYYCEKCKGYLKTYDERLTNRLTDLYIANVETVYLDMLAKAKGFMNYDYDSDQ